MPAYVIAGTNVTDVETMREYSKMVPATLEPFGGEFLVRGGELDVLEGEWTTSRIVVIAFPSLEQARNWYQSEVYQAIIQTRFDAATTDFFLLADGIA